MDTQELEKKARIRQKKHNNKLARQFPLFQDNLEYFNPLSLQDAREIVKKNLAAKETFAERFDKTRKEFQEKCSEHIAIFKAVLKDYVSDYEIDAFERYCLEHERFIKDKAYESDFYAARLVRLLGLMNMTKLWELLNLK
jgi:hypothetical protein